MRSTRKKEKDGKVNNGSVVGGKRVEPEIAKANKELALEEVPNVLQIKIGDSVIPAPFHEFNTGSKGWKAMGPITVDGVKCRVMCNIVISGSKPKTEVK